jgi:energy-coupling factor transporter transmembrane protein EcfT
VIVPRLKILTLIVLAVAAFLIRDPRVLGAGFVLLMGAWAVLRLPAPLLFRLFRKLTFFVLMILLAFAFFPAENIQGDVGRQIALPGTPIMISLTGLLLGGLMALRMLIVIIASQIVQLTA